MYFSQIKKQNIAQRIGVKVLPKTLSLVSKIKGPSYKFTNETVATITLYRNNVKIGSATGENGPWGGTMPQWIRNTMDPNKPRAQKNLASGDAELHALANLEEKMGDDVNFNDGAKYTITMTATRPECSSCTARILRWCKYYGITRV